MKSRVTLNNLEPFPRWSNHLTKLRMKEKISALSPSQRKSLPSSSSRPAPPPSMVSSSRSRKSRPNLTPDLAWHLWAGAEAGEASTGIHTVPTVTITGTATVILTSLEAGLATEDTAAEAGASISTAGKVVLKEELLEEEVREGTRQE